MQAGEGRPRTCLNGQPRHLDMVIYYTCDRQNFRAVSHYLVSVALLVSIFLIASVLLPSSPTLVPFGTSSGDGPRLEPGRKVERRDREVIGRGVAMMTARRGREGSRRSTTPTDLGIGSDAKACAVCRRSGKHLSRVPRSCSPWCKVRLEPSANNSCKGQRPSG